MTTDNRKTVENPYYSNEPVSVIRMENGKMLLNCVPMVLRIKKIKYSFESFSTVFGKDKNNEKNDGKNEINRNNVDYDNKEDTTYRNNNISCYQMMTQQEMYVRITIGAWCARTKSRILRRTDSLQWLELDFAVLTTAADLDYGGGLLLELVNSNMSLDDVVVGRAVLGTSGLLGK